MQKNYRFSAHGCQVQYALPMAVSNSMPVLPNVLKVTRAQRLENGRVSEHQALISISAFFQIPASYLSRNSSGFKAKGADHFGAATATRTGIFGLIFSATAKTVLA